jgi:hypothetical protein
MDEACDWLRGHGLHAARCGTGPGHDLGFVVDAYDELPAMLVRQNPPYYHALLKEAGFATEKAWIDYRAEAGPENVARWEALAATVPAGHRVVTLAEVPAERRLADFTAVWNDAFRSHWGMAPTPVAELEAAAGWAGATGMIEHSLLAYRGDEAVGAVWTNPELSRLARLAPGRQLAPAERLNFLGVGVREHARGHGLGRALVARSYLDLHRAGATHVGYTMVLDDNWPSRRTAESLHATVRANYLVYRRDLG